jgi:hypothetical protein
VEEFSTVRSEQRCVVSPQLRAVREARRELYPLSTQSAAAILAAMPSAKIAKVLVAAACLAVAAVVGYVLFKEGKKRYEARAVVSIVQNATAQLKAGLKTPTREGIEQIEADIRRTHGWSNVEIADATEQYLIGAREILRRRAEATRLSQKAAASRAALVAHMDRAPRRDLPWIRVAMDLKKQVERDHFDLDVQLGALADLLGVMPEANKRLAPHVSASLLFEDSVRRSARDAVLQEARRARSDLDKARGLLH